MGGSCSTNGKKRNECRLLVRKPEEKRPLKRSRSKWVNNIQMDLERQDGVIWTGLVWIRIQASGGLL
jgi:hypothetical protein